MASSIAAVAAKSIGGPRSSLSNAVDRLPLSPINVSETERWLSLAGGVTLLGCALNAKGSAGLMSLAGGVFLLYRGASGHCPISKSVGLNTAGGVAENAVIPAGEGKRVEASVVVKKPAKEVYRFWRDLENLPRFMNHLVDVDTTSDGHSQWTAKGPLGIRVHWEAEIISDQQNKLISWKSLKGSDVDIAGSVSFKELSHGQGTKIDVELKYDPPGGRLGTAVAKAFGEDPQRQINEDLERFKQVMEKMPVSS